MYYNKEKLKITSSLRRYSFPCYCKYRQVPTAYTTFSLSGEYIVGIFTKQTSASTAASAVKLNNPQVLNLMENRRLEKIGGRERESNSRGGEGGKEIN